MKLKRQDIWDLLFKSTLKASKMSIVQFVMSDEYERMKRRFGYFCKKFPILNLKRTGEKK